MADSSGLSGKWMSLPESDRRALSLMVVFLAVVAGYIVVLEPLLSRYQRANTELTELLDRYDSNTRKVGLLPRREANLTEYRSQLVQINQRFSVAVASTQSAVSRTLAELNSYARLSSVEVESIKPGEAQEFETYTEVPFEIEVSGAFSDLRRFLYYIDTSPSLLATTRLNLRYDSSASTKASLEVTDIVRLTSEAQSDLQFSANSASHLRLVASEGLGYHAIREAIDEGVFDSDNAVVDLVQANDTVTVERLLLSKDIDAISLTVLDLIGYWERGIPLIAVLPIGESRGAEGIVVAANSAVQSVADIARSSVAVDQNGILQFVLYKALAQSGLTINSVNQRLMSASQVARDVAAGTTTVGLTREPYLSRLINLDQARLIFSTHNSEIPTIDVLAVRPDVLVKKRGALQLVVNAMLDITQQSSAVRQQAGDFSSAHIRRYNADAAMAYFNGDLPRNRLAQYETFTTTLNKPLILISSNEFLDSSFIEHYLSNVSGTPISGGEVPEVSGVKDGS